MSSYRPKPPPPAPRRAVRKPHVLALLGNYLERQGSGTATGIRLKVVGKGWPTRVTAPFIANALLEQLDWLRHMSSEHSPDPDDEASTRRFPVTEAEIKRNLELMSRAVGGPLGPELLGFVDKELLAETERWGQLADELEQELGPDFLRGTDKVRAAMVRDWIRNYRERGDLPSKKTSRR
jgi:hypothetical protein